MSGHITIQAKGILEKVRSRTWPWTWVGTPGSSNKVHAASTSPSSEFLAVVSGWELKGGKR